MDSGVHSMWLFVFVVSGLLTRNSESLGEVFCGGFDMRNHPDEIMVKYSKQADLLKNCTVVEGDVKLVMLTRENQTSEEFPSFPTIREITGFLLVFQVHGLDSIGRVFPNLRAIRGKNLLLNYGLTVYQNPDLKEIGLFNLIEISRGGVRITENKELCFGDMVNWVGLCKDSLKEIVDIVVERNKNPDQCDVGCDEVVNGEKICQKRPENSPKYYCWNRTVCQKGCPKKCETGCYWEGDEQRCCHEECVGGCVGRRDNDCLGCRNRYHKGRCLPDCPEDMFVVKGRRCLTEQECKNRTPEGEGVEGVSAQAYLKAINGSCKDSEYCPVFYKAHNRSCVIDCPRDFEEDPNDPTKCVKCKGTCLKKCLGGIIASLDEAKALEGCNIVRNIQIRIQSGGEGNVSAVLAKYMKDIQEVKDFLVVSFTPALVSLDFLKSIHTIHGDQLYTEQYALSVFENENMVRLFHEDHLLQIKRGVLQFHNNPLLCYKKIQKFAKSLNISLNKEDASARSNGNKAICEELEIPVNLKTSDNEGFVLSWEGFNLSVLGIDERQFLGYQIYYKEVKDGEVVEMFQDRDACHDSWNMIFEGKERGILINQLRPNTNYAFYVKTVIVHHEDAKGGISKIHIFKTKFGAPSKPIIKKLVSETPNSILIEWYPPSEPNGDVTHYKVQFTGTRDRVSQTRDYCENRPKYNDNEDMGMAVGDFEPPASDPVPQSGSVRSGQCSAISKNCCECPSGQEPKNGSVELQPDEAELKKRRERHQFENAVHNIVFMKNKKAVKAERGSQMESRIWRRSLPTSGMPRKSERSISHVSSHRDLGYFGDFGEFDKRKKREISENSPINALTNEKMEENGTLATDDWRQYTTISFNTTETKVLLKNLKHFTNYQIKIWACQNTSAEYNYCTAQPVSTVKRTMAIPANDEIIGPVAEVRKTVDSKTFHVFSWIPPANPNGKIFLYDLEFLEVGEGTKIPTCTSHVDFKKQGYRFKYPELRDGNFSLRVRALTQSGEGRWTRSIYIVVKSPPSIKSWIVVVLCVVIPCVVLALAAVVGLYLHRRNLRKKMPEYIMNVISACPDYISTLDVYKPDEWELRRDDMELLREIGQGTFGKVFAGRGRNVRSICGAEFGECAVKTVQESAGHWDRLTFLFEASIMKNFNTAFIVKLYGVVSDGQPALVVMEMMHKGIIHKLRDTCSQVSRHVRGRRPRIY